MKIKVDDLQGDAVRQLLREHLQHMASLSPACSMHALDLEGLCQPNVTLWSIWEQNRLAGCGALKQLDAFNGEIKSMRTAREFLRRGVGARLLQHIVAEAKKRGYRRLSLETGSQSGFEPARRLYMKFGFQLCKPFADYREDPNSVYMSKVL